MKYCTLLPDSSSTNQWRKQVDVNIYYESLIFERRKTTYSYTLWSFISDIGGNTRLFLGLTLLSWVEFMLLLVRQEAAMKLMF